MIQSSQKDYLICLSISGGVLWGLRKAFPVWWNWPYISQIITYHSSYKNITPVRDWTLQGDLCYSLTSWSYLHILVRIWNSITAVHLEGPLSDCLIKDSKLVQLLMAKLSFPVSVLNMQSTHNTTNLQKAWLYTPELAHCYCKDWDLLTIKRSKLEVYPWQQQWQLALSK